MIDTIGTLGAPQSHVLPTVGEVLELPAVAMGLPHLLVDERCLQSRVRWVHVCEQPDMAVFVDEGDLVLTSGMGLNRNAAAWIPIVDLLADRGACGLFLELGLFFDGLPDAVIARAEERGLALVVLDRSTRFVDITHGVHRMIMDRQLEELRRVADVHSRFTQLTVGNASFGEIVTHAANLLRSPVVVEDLAHRVLGIDAGHHPSEDVLQGWSSRSAGVTTTERLEYVESTAMLVVNLGMRGESWGRLMVLLEAVPTPTDTLVADRAAIALELQRLLEADDQALELHSNRSLLNSVTAQTYSSISSMASEIEAAGVPVLRRMLVGGCVRLGQLSPAKSPSITEHRAHLHIVMNAMRSAGVRGLVTDKTNGQVRVMVSARRVDDLDAELARFARSVHDHARDASRQAVIAFGSAVSSLDGVRRSCEESDQVISVAGDDDRLFHRLDDVRIRGLLHLLNTDPRLQHYTERQLAALTTLPTSESSELLDTLRVYLDHGRNKAATSRAMHLSRPTLYARLAKIGRLVKADIEDPAVALSLQFALYAHAAISTTAP